MRLALISHGPPEDPQQFSGIPWHVLQELRRQGHQVEPFSAEPTAWALQLAQFKNRLSLKFSGQPHHVEADPSVLRTRSHQLNKKIRTYAPDAVLCVGFPEAAVALAPALPLYIWMDALYPSVRRLYAYFKTYYGEKDAQTLGYMENTVLKRSRRCWLSSDWAVAEACTDFPQSAKRFAVQSFGANLEDPPGATDVIQTISARKLDAPAFLFLVNEWERKGGVTAVATVQRLRQQGCPARLIVIGLKDRPATVPAEAWVEWVGRLDKSKPDEAKRLRQYFSESAFLLLPTTADCTPIVCHEAAAFGLPVLATDVGGLPSTVDAGESGMLWPLARFIEEATRWITTIVKDRPRYEKMARASRRRFETCGNWAVNVRAVAKVMAMEKV